MSMQVIEGASFGDANVLKLKELPSPMPEKDSLLIDVRAAGVNYLDLVTLDFGKVQPGANVLVSAAAGGVGAMAVQIAKLKGANVIGLASRTKHDFVRKNGADHVFDYRSPAWSSSVREVVGDRGVDIFL